MNKFLDLIRLTLISPEIIVGLLVYFGLHEYIEFPKFISTYFFNENMQWQDYLKLFGVPIGILGLMYKYSDSILNPEDKENRQVLKQWPNYWMLKNRVYFSLIIAIISFIGTIGSWYYAQNMNLIDGTVYILVFWSVLLVSFITIALAKLSIKDILY